MVRLYSQRSGQRKTVERPVAVYAQGWLECLLCIAWDKPIHWNRFKINCTSMSSGPDERRDLFVEYLLPIINTIGRDIEGSGQRTTSRSTPIQNNSRCCNVRITIAGWTTAQHWQRSTNIEDDDDEDRPTSPVVWERFADSHVWRIPWMLCLGNSKCNFRTGKCSTWNNWINHLNRYVIHQRTIRCSSGVHLLRH